jgi:hypothetical protein
MALEGWVWLLGILALWALAFWLGGRHFRATQSPQGRALVDAIIQAEQLRKTDPLAADRLLDQHFASQAEAAAADRDHLRELARHDIAAAEQLRAELEKDLASDEAAHKEFSRKPLTDTSVQAALVQIEASATQTRDELVGLEAHIAQLYRRG